MAGLLVLLAVQYVSAEEKNTPEGVDSLAVVYESVRNGDIKACEDLADRYHDGRVVAPSFMNMYFMYLQAENLGGETVEEYLKRYQDADSYRLVSKAMDEIDQRKYARAERKVRVLKERGLPAWKALQARVVLQRDHDAQQADRLLGEAVKEGSELAALVRAELYRDRRQDSLYVSALRELCGSVPTVHNLLGKYYWRCAESALERGESGEAGQWRVQAIHCFKEADRFACLTRSNARRWVSALEDEPEGKSSLTAVEWDRLRKLAGK